METTEKHRLALLNNGQSMNHQDFFFVYFLTERLPLKHGKLGKFLHQEKNVSVTISSWNFSKKDAKLRNIIVAIDIDW